MKERRLNNEIGSYIHPNHEKYLLSNYYLFLLIEQEVDALKLGVVKFILDDQLTMMKKNAQCVYSSSTSLDTVGPCIILI